ncbi:hypothetical protein D5F01_LYC16104 [Larimichthys crocea]|uniref:Uncharacterized protein n=1 Tax=Larimichthys crocea TaxID=215358 RepID=A0A6G0I4Q8_LARCR|nr:hypothetical protein D5F01_LYC16104 [Larimichthys crocea]
MKHDPHLNLQRKRSHRSRTLSSSDRNHLLSPPPPPPPPLARALAAVMETPAGVLRPLCVTVQLHAGEPAGGEKSSQDQLRGARGNGEEVQDGQRCVESAAGAQRFCGLIQVSGRAPEKGRDEPDHGNEATPYGGERTVPVLGELARRSSSCSCFTPSDCHQHAPPSDEESIAHT